ncbi:MAG: aspartate/glutamate racemase family protein [Castellaniella sp.]|uniref:Aspartate/glutamate racemase family protein n=1 Tax=Castellaniella hirudinis TaxID=1144617 RepID=A0ABV8S0H5_9BURK
MTKRVLLGMLTPSSNTALEPLTSAMVSGIPGVSAHFARFTVTQISLDRQSLGQFDIGKILDAARQLADARVDVIGWSGTAASWLGFETDEALCREITAATGIPATTSVLALNEILEKTGVRKLGLVSPYIESVQRQIMANYEAAGIQVPGERHAGLQVNFAFSEVSESEVLRMAREVAGYGPDALTVMCTNVKAAQLAERIESELGIPLYDSVSTVVWKALKIAGVDPAGIQDWGRLFREVA